MAILKNTVKVSGFFILTTSLMFGLINGELKADLVRDTKIEKNHINININDISFDLENNEELKIEIQNIRQYIKGQLDGLATNYINNYINKKEYNKRYSEIVAESKKQVDKYSSNIKVYALGKLKVLEDLYNEEKITFKDYNNRSHETLKQAKENLNLIKQPIEYADPFEKETEHNKIEEKNELNPKQETQINMTIDAFKEKLEKTYTNKEDVEKLDEMLNRIADLRERNNSLFINIFLDRLYQQLEQMIKKLK